MVFAAVGISAIALLLLGLVWIRVYDRQLIRQTEAELLAQGVPLREAYLRLLRPEGEALPEDLGNPPQPVLPQLTGADEVLPPPDDGPAALKPPDAEAERAGAQLMPLLKKVAQQTLAGIRVLDAHGTVIATSREGLGTTLLGRQEVRRALAGEQASALRARLRDPGDAPLESLSRETGYRVSVVLPIFVEGEVVGALLLSRTPMTVAKAFYVDRFYLSATALMLAGLIAFLSAAAAALVVRPVRALLAQTRAIANGEDIGFEPIARPMVSELAELSFAQARMARELRSRNEYIRSFAANVSHEFKTPLSSIQGAVELLAEKDAPLSPEQRERFLSNVDADAKRLTALVKQLLELARADAMTSRREEAAVRPVFSALRERAGKTGVALILPEVSEALSAPVSAELLDSVLWQLIWNAYQHNRPPVRIELVVISNGSRLEKVAVKDDGQGISEANRARIFDAFFTTARDRGGTGMGLTIARAMLRSVGAEIRCVESKTGACFELVF